MERKPVACRIQTARQTDTVYGAVINSVKHQL